MKSMINLSGLCLISCLLLYGCGDNMFESVADDSSDEAKQVEISKALDNGEYQTVINALEGQTTYAGFSADETAINLAAAYVGVAGFDIPTLVNDFLNSKSDDPSVVDEDSFETLMSSVALKLTANASGVISNLDNASTTYGRLTTSNDCATPDLTRYEKDACFFKGLIDVARATTGLTLPLGSDDVADIGTVISAWSTQNDVGAPAYTCSEDADQGGVLDVADATACGAEYAVLGSCSQTYAAPLAQAPIIFTDADGVSTYSYTPLDITINAAGVLYSNYTISGAVAMTMNMTIASNDLPISSSLKLTFDGVLTLTGGEITDVTVTNVTVDAGTEIVTGTITFDEVAYPASDFDFIPES